MVCRPIAQFRRLPLLSLSQNRDGQLQLVGDTKAFTLMTGNFNFVDDGDGEILSSDERIPIAVGEKKIASGAEDASAFTRGETAEPRRWAHVEPVSRRARRAQCLENLSVRLRIELIEGR